MVRRPRRRRRWRASARSCWRATTRASAWCSNATPATGARRPTGRSCRTSIGWWWRSSRTRAPSCCGCSPAAWTCVLAGAARGPGQPAAARLAGQDAALRAGRHHRSGLVLLQPAPGLLGEGPARRVAGGAEFRQAISHAVDREAFANSCSWAPRCPSGARSRPATAVVLAQRAALSLLAGQRADAAGGRRADQPRCRRVARGREGHRGAVHDHDRGQQHALRAADHAIRDDLRRAGIAVEVVPARVRRHDPAVAEAQLRRAVLQLRRHLADPALNKDFWLSSGPRTSGTRGRRRRPRRGKRRSTI